MTSFAIAEGWTMTGNGPRGGRDGSNWREVATAWAVAVVLAGALVLTVPRHTAESPPASIWSINPSAGGHVHQPTSDAEGPTADQACSDRDYANERC
jgi:hypothetical protein